MRMNKPIRLFMYVGVVAALIALGRTQTFALDPGHTAENPIQVGKAGAVDKDGNPKGLKKQTEGRTTASGSLSFDCKNTSGKAATDVHVKILPTTYKIETMDVVSDDWEDESTPPPAASNPRSINAKANKSVAVDGTILVELKIVDEDGNAVNNDKVQVQVWWTRGASHDIVISNTSAKDIGDGDPVTTLASLNIPGYSASPYSALPGTQQVDVYPVVLAERDGYRFENGSLILAADGNERLELISDTTVVEAYDENGDQVVSQTRVSFSNLRINSDGCFVVDVNRNPDDTLHLAIVIRGLRVVGLQTREAGETLSGTISGAAVSGRYLESIVELVEVGS